MLQRMAGFLFGFGSYFILVRYFEIDDFGIWTLFVLVGSVFEMSRSAFIQNAFIKFFNLDDVDKDDLFSASIFLNAITTLIFIILLLILIPILSSFWDSAIIGNLILWYCFTSVILIPLTQLNYLEQANHSFVGVFWSTVVRQGSFFLIVISAYLFFPGLPLVFFAAMQSGSALLGLFIAFVFSGRMLPAIYLLRRDLVVRLFRFGRYILGTGITSTIGKSADQFILGGVNHGMVAMFNASVRIINFIEIPSLSISNITYPKMAERVAKDGNNGPGLLYEKSVAMILSIILPIVIFVLTFPEFVLLITAGRKYLDATTPLRIMATASIFLPFNIQIGSVCEVINRPQISFYINLFSNILNVTLNIVLIHLYGVVGAAVAYACTLCFIFIFSQWYLTKQVRLSISNIPVLILVFYQELFVKVKNLILR